LGEVPFKALRVQSILVVWSIGVPLTQLRRRQVGVRVSLMPVEPGVGQSWAATDVRYGRAMVALCLDAVVGSLGHLTLEPCTAALPDHGAEETVQYRQLT
jgi:hypothetical protein